jgi:hypoxanthine phosphoribosyltransferase
MDPKHRVLFSAEQLQARVKELGEQITAEYKDQELTVVGLLEDSFIFFADLIRAINCPLSCGFTYVKKHSIGGHTDIHYTSEFDLMGRNLLLVGDIMDTGITYDYLTKQLSSRNPRSIKICVLLDKPEQRRIDIQPEFFAFNTPEDNIFGYGLGIQGMYRQYPFLAVAESPS